MGIIGLFLLIIISIVSPMLGFWIYLSDRNSKINRWFLSISISILLWNIFAYLGYRSSIPDQSIIFFKFNFYFVSLFFIAFYFFTLHFPLVSKKRSYLIDGLIAFFAGLFALASLFTNTIIADVLIPEPGKLIVKMGSLGNLFYLFTIIVTIYILYILLKKK